MIADCILTAEPVFLRHTFITVVRSYLALAESSHDLPIFQSYNYPMNQRYESYIHTEGNILTHAFEGSYGTYLRNIFWIAC